MIINYLKNYPIHFVLFAIFPILFFFSHNISETTLAKMALPLIASLLGSVLFFGIFYALTRNLIKSGILSSVFVFLFFSYGHITKILSEIFSTKISNIEPVLFLLWISSFFFLFYIVKKSQKDFSTINAILNIVALILITFSLFNSGLYEMRSGRLIKAQEKLNGQNIRLENEPTKPKRDIYYIIADRYANQNVLKSYYNYDNSPFMSFLEKKGFYIAGNSSANYSKTFLSLASSLNMNYLDFLKKDYPDSNDWSVVYPLIENNEVVKLLKNVGYKFYYFGSWWEPTRVNKNADKNINYHGIGIFDEFTSKLLETTLIHPLIRNDDDWLDKVRAGHDYQFSQLEKIAKVPGPKFVFVHLLLPHDPYVYDKNCQEVNKKYKVGTSEDEKAYIEQLVCTNTKFEKLITNIVSKSKNEPIIIFQSDEGPFPAEYNGVGGKISWKSLSNNGLHTHMKILNTYFLPGIENKEKILDSDISPVNTFRIIFNQYFGTSLPLLPNKSYIFDRMERPYDFIDVTEKLK